MKITAQAFLDQPRKAITLIGMSGVGKSYLSCRLAEWGWQNYSCDYLIATKYLSEMISDGGELRPDNIANLSDFVGQIGNPEHGGVGLDEFKRRQSLYYEAECQALCDFVDVVKQTTNGHIVNDSAGSLCEVEDESVLADVAAQSLFIYLRVSPKNHKQILERAIWTPKPLYFPPAFFEERLAAFQDKFEAKAVEEIDPEMFLRWAFPHLFDSRLPKYQRLADRYGVTINVEEVADIESEEAFLSVVGKALDEQKS